MFETEVFVLFDWNLSRLPFLGQVVDLENDKRLSKAMSTSCKIHQSFISHEK